jgi:hypothetical protein
MKPMMIAAIGAALMCNSCGTSKQDQMESKKESNQGAIPTPPLGPPPNTCLVHARVDEINRTLSSANEKDPCSKAPCLATITIDSVLGYGSAFPAILTAGAKISVKFLHTLNPTKDVWPEIQPPLPGLRVGYRFKALMSGSVALGKKDAEYSISRYELQQ